MNILLQSNKQSCKLCLVTVLLLILATSLGHAQTSGHTHPVCGATCTDGANHTEALIWTPVTASNINTALNTSGNYYLAEDIQLNAMINITKQNANIHLCLNGHVLKAKTGERAIRTEIGKNVTLTICDCRPENTEGTLSATRTLTSPVDGSQINIIGGLITGGNHSGNGGAIMLNDATLDLYGGTIGGNSTPAGGGAICLGVATFTMYAGTICCNTTVGDSSSDGGGVGFYIGDSNTFHLKGGTISHNKAGRNGGGISLTLSNSKISNFTMSGDATVEHNSADYGGGIYCFSVEFTMNGGFIRNNQTKLYGGGIHLSNPKATLSGGEITGNTSTKGASAKYYRSGAGIFYSGYNDSFFKISGAPRISGNTNNDHADDLFIQTPITIAGPLTNTAPIGISYLKVDEQGHGSPQNFTIGWSTQMSDKKPSDYFVSSDTGIYVLPHTGTNTKYTEGRMGVGYTFGYELPADVQGAEEVLKEQPYYGLGDQVNVIFPENMTRPGYTFDNKWYYGNNTYTNEQPYYTIVGIPAIKLNPIWKLKKPTLVITPESPVVTSKGESVSLNAQASLELESGVTYQYEWYTCSDPDKANPSSPVYANTYTTDINTAVGTYYYYCKVKAKVSDDWSEYTESDVITVHVGYAVTFDKADGTPPSKLNVIASQSVGDQLPTVDTAGFAGWYTSDGTAFTAETSVTQNMTVTAKYKYDTTISDDLSHGQIRISSGSPVFAKETVTLTITPDAGYRLADNTLKVYKTGDEAMLIEVTDNTFIMPMHPVTLSATFEPDTLNLAKITATGNSVLISQEASDKTWWYEVKATEAGTKSLRSADSKIPFNGIITGTLTTGKALVMDATCQGEIVFTDVTVPTLIIEAGAAVVLSKESKLTYTTAQNNGGSLVAKAGATITDGAGETIKTSAITFTASANGTLTVQVGTTTLASGDMVTEGSKFTVTTTPAPGYETASVKVMQGTAELTATAGVYTMPSEAITLSVTFRRIEVTPPTVYYTVTLPAITGAVTNPIAGSYAVEEGSNFLFVLTLDADYNQSIPLVKANGTIVAPRPSDGKYVINSVREDQTITIDGIMKNSPPVGNAEIETDNRIYTANGVLYVRVAQPTEAQIITIGGNVLRSLHLSAGETTVHGLSQGIYIVRLSNGTTQIVKI